MLKGKALRYAVSFVFVVCASVPVSVLQGNPVPSSTGTSAAQGAPPDSVAGAGDDAAANGGPDDSPETTKQINKLKESSGTTPTGQGVENQIREQNNHTADQFTGGEGRESIQDFGKASKNMNKLGEALGAEPLNPAKREAYRKAIETARARENAIADAIRKSGKLSASEIGKIVELTRQSVDTSAGIDDSRLNRNNNNDNRLTPERAQQIADRVQDIRNFVPNEAPPRLENLDEYKLFTANGEEIPVLVDNTELTSGNFQPQAQTGLEDKFAAIAAGPAATTSNITVNSSASASATAPAAGSAGAESFPEETAAEKSDEVAAAASAQVGRGPASTEESEGLTVEDLLKALLTPEEALEEEENGIEIDYADGAFGEDQFDEQFQEQLGKEIPLVLRPGKLRALQRGLSGRIDKPTQIGTRTGNGFHAEDDLLLMAGEKFPVLRGLFEKARTSPTAAQLLFWLSIAVSLYFMMKLVYNLSHEPRPSYASASYFTAAREHQHDHLAEELEISFTEPQPVGVQDPMARRYGSIPMVQVDPELGQLQENGEIPSGSFEVIEHTAHSLTAVTAITKEVTGTLAPWTAQEGELEAHKIYIKMDPHSTKWYLVRTNAEGRVGETLAEIFPGTVVEGQILGAQFTAKRYRLKQNGKWAPTADRVQFVVSVMPAGQGPDWWA